MGKLTYNRSTTFTLTHNYQKNGVASSDGSKLFFTVKPSQFDTSDLDDTAIIKKTITMTGPTNVITITPSDVQETVAPGTYYYDLKVTDNVVGIILADSGQFKLVGTPTNRLT